MGHLEVQAQYTLANRRWRAAAHPFVWDDSLGMFVVQPVGVKSMVMVIDVQVDVGKLLE